MDHGVTVEGPKNRRVIVFTCKATGEVTRLVKNWSGPPPNGAIIGNCGHQLRVDGQ